MRIISLALISAAFVVAAPAHAQDAASSDTASPELTIEASASIESQWVESRQLLTQSTDPLATVTVTGCVGDVCAYVWHGRDLKNPGNQETDFGLSGSKELGNGFSIDGDLAFYALSGENAVNLEVGVSKSLTENVSVRVSYQGTRGGFTENSLQLEVPIAFNLSDSATFDVTPAVLYSDYAGAVGASITGGASVEVVKGVKGRLFGTAYAGAGKSDFSFGLSITVSF